MSRRPPPHPAGVPERDPVSGSELVSGRELARRLGVSAPLITRWLRERVIAPVQVARSKGRGHRYDVEACRRAAQAARPNAFLGGGGHGGKRDGAGKKRRVGAQSKRSVKPGSSPHTTPQNAHEGAHRNPEPQPTTAPPSPHEIALLAQAQARARGELLKLREREVEFAARRGTIVAKTDVERLFARHAAAVRQVTRREVEKLGEDIVAALGLEAEAAAHVQEAARRTIESIGRAIAADPFPPAAESPA